MLRFCFSGFSGACRCDPAAVIGQTMEMGKGVASDEARAGDLVFFRGGIFNGINHVGIYMGNKTFIHASNKNGVMYDTLDEAYYKKRFAGIRRIL